MPLVKGLSQATKDAIRLATGTLEAVAKKYCVSPSTVAYYKGRSGPKNRYKPIASKTKKQKLHQVATQESPVELIEIIQARAKGNGSSGILGDLQALQFRIERIEQVLGIED